MERVQEDVRLDLLLKSGHVIDPVNGVDGVRDVGIRDGKIAAVTEGLASDGAAHVIDVAGLLVTPGLIDIHVHAYENRLNPAPGKFTGSLNADAHFLSDGVTTCVDTGTAGHDEISHFRQTVIEKKVCLILAYVNISAPGMGNSEQDVLAIPIRNLNLANLSVPKTRRLSHFEIGKTQRTRTAHLLRQR